MKSHLSTWKKEEDIFCSTRTHYPDSESTNLCSYSFKLRSKRRHSKYQIYSFWFHPTGSEPTTYRTRDNREYANHYTTDVVGDNTNTKCQILIYILNEC